ncbi:ABC transporter permease [Caldisericum exile]|uniref:ABC transporter permease n=1 Tax=Caldisericum exile TaxID=693075 RepID=UPI0002F5BDFE|nr:ABC transporter permease [Caldisericum exile]
MKKTLKVVEIALAFGLFVLTLSKSSIISIVAFFLFVVLLVRLIKNSRILKGISFVLFLYLWQIISIHKLVPSYILPSPMETLQIVLTQSNVILPNLIATLEVTFIGFFFSILFGILLALIMHIAKPIEDLIYPIAVITQSTPTIAIAPLIILWLGFGTLPKIVVVIWATFFPITVNTLLGLRTVDSDMIDVLKAISAKKSDIFKYVIFPHTFTYIITGIEISSPYAILGTLTAEWMGTTVGMGLYIRRSFSSFRLDQVFAGTIIIIIFSLLMWGSATILRQRFTRYLGGEK